jgi:hypothetical protein
LSTVFGPLSDVYWGVVINKDPQNNPLRISPPDLYYRRSEVLVATAGGLKISPSLKNKPLGDFILGFKGYCRIKRECIMPWDSPPQNALIMTEPAEYLNNALGFTTTAGILV